VPVVCPEWLATAAEVAKSGLDRHRIAEGKNSAF
jgi:hypothetical protein